MSIPNKPKIIKLYEPLSISWLLVLRKRISRSIKRDRTKKTGI